mgnify:CR=1 FL=1
MTDAGRQPPRELAVDALRSLALLPVVAVNWVGYAALPDADRQPRRTVQMATEPAAHAGKQQHRRSEREHAGTRSQYAQADAVLQVLRQHRRHHLCADRIADHGNECAYETWTGQQPEIDHGM